MRNILLVCLAAVALFSLSAALSLFLNGHAPRETGEKGGEKAEHKKSAESSGPSQSATEPAPALSHEPAAKGSDEVASLLVRLRERTSELQRREDEVRKQEKRLQVIGDDVRAERAVIDSLRKQLSDELKKLKDRQSGLDTRERTLGEQKASATRQMADMEKRRLKLSESEVKNLSRMASISDSMPADRAASLLQQLADSGQLDTAVKLLGQMRERRAAQVLAEMNDTTLAAQLMEKLRGLSRPPTGS